MMIPDAWLDDCSDEIELMAAQQRLRDIGALLIAFRNAQQRLRDIGALLIAFRKVGDERLLELAITMTGEYDE